MSARTSSFLRLPSPSIVSVPGSSSGVPGGSSMPRDTEALIDEHAFEEHEFLPYWAELWPSGVALARAVAGRALKGATVLEIGCGLGLPSLAAARAGGRVLATDWSSSAIDLLLRNAERNEVAPEAAVIKLTD